MLKNEKKSGLEVSLESNNVNKERIQNLLRLLATDKLKKIQETKAK